MIRSLADAWNRFFFTPQRPNVLGLYRIVFAAVVLFDLLLLRPDWLAWFGEDSILTLRSLAARASLLNVFAIWPHKNSAIVALYWIMVLFAVLLLIGFMSRFSSMMVFLALLSMHKSNPMILSGGDVLLRLDAFFLMFAPSGAALSVDRLIRKRRGHSGKPRLVLPWAQRMIQIQTTLVYLSSFCWKLLGHTWLDGTALYYVLHLDEFRQFAVPFANNLAAIKLLTWATLLLELSLGTLVWIKRLRYWVLLAGVCLHAGIEYALNIPLFSATIVASYLTFIDPRDVDALRSWWRVRTRAGKLAKMTT